MPTYQTRRFSRTRALIADILTVYRDHNTIHGLYQLDVTEARQCVHAYKTRTGQDFSFTAFLIGCVARMVDENKDVQALRRGKQIIVFDDVDVNVQIERDFNGKKGVVPYIVRAANHKTTIDIHHEIREAQLQPVTDESPTGDAPRWLVWAAMLPRCLRLKVLRWKLNDAFTVRQMSGTVDLTAIGMVGQGGGWGIAIAETSFALVVGGIESALRQIDGQLCERELLSITLTFDHDLIDGAPATRAAMRLKELVESAYGLESLRHAEKSPPLTTD